MHHSSLKSAGYRVVEWKGLAFVKKASWATAPLGVLAFWGGILIAARRYPSEYDWRYMPVSDLLSATRNPAGYLWASTGIVLCSLCVLCWAAILAQRWAHAKAIGHPSGLRAIQLGNFCMACSAALPKSLLPIRKGHELLTFLAFAGLCLGLVSMMFQTVERILLRRKRGSIRNSRRYASVLAGSAVLPILLAGLAQAYVFYALPALHWVNLSWRASGVPAYLSFAFWEWITCVMLSAYMMILGMTASRAPSRNVSHRYKTESAASTE
jgi:hypothetical protein